MECAYLKAGRVKEMKTKTNIKAGQPVKYMNFVLKEVLISGVS
jgi:hypothetical protein